MADIVYNPVAGVPFSGGLRMYDCGDGSFAPTGLSISGTSPVASLSAVSATGPGAALDNTGVRNNHSLTITSGAGVATGAVKLEGSQDNVNWFQLIAPVTVPAANATSNTAATQTPVRYLRANISTVIGGGTITAYVGQAQAEMWPFSKREEKRAITAIDGYWPDYSEPTNQFGHVTVSRALSLIPVFAAARLLAQSLSSMPLLLLKRDEQGIPRRQPTPSLFRNPSIHGTTVDWIHRGVVSMALQGDAIGLITQRDFYNYPTMIEWLNPENVATHDGKLEGPGSYINPLWWWWGRPIDPANLLHIPWFSMPWRVRGLSPIGAFQLTCNRGIGASEYGANWYANGGVPPGHFRNTAKTIDDKDATQLVARFMARLQSRKPLVTGADWEYTPIAIKPHEALFIETERMTATQIANVYGIPPERIGGTTGNNLTYTTVEQNTIDLLTFCLHPWMVKFEAALSNCFPGGQYVRFDPSEMLRVDAKTQAEIDQTSLGYMPPAWMEVDEVRANRDLPPMTNPPPNPAQQTPSKQNVLVPGRPANGQPLTGNGEKRGLDELVRLETMRQRWTNGAHVAMKGS